jgi:hypothetical protein
LRFQDALDVAVKDLLLLFLSCSQLWKIFSRFVAVGHHDDTEHERRGDQLTQGGVAAYCGANSRQRLAHFPRDAQRDCITEQEKTLLRMKKKRETAIQRHSSIYADREARTSSVREKREASLISA